MTERAGDIPAEPPPYRARLRAAWGPAVALSLALHAALAATARMEQIVSVDLTGPARMAIKEAFPREEEAPGEPPSAGEAEPVETEPPGEEVAGSQEPAAVVPPAPPEDGPRAGDTAEPQAEPNDLGTPAAEQDGPTRPAEPMHALRPEYPPRAVRRGHEGRVVIAAHVTAGGRVDQTRVVTSSAHASLDAAARRAVRAARFRPALMDGEPVESWVNVPVRFALR